MAITEGAMAHCNDIPFGFISNGTELLNKTCVFGNAKMPITIQKIPFYTKFGLTQNILSIPSMKIPHVLLLSHDILHNSGFVRMWYCPVFGGRPNSNSTKRWMEEFCRLWSHCDNCYLFSLYQSIGNRLRWYYDDYFARPVWSEMHFI